jgi:diguanylate cyclase (GGDEF)-like protein/putative nucleotidyltransferase with HDIG domain
VISRPRLGPILALLAFCLCAGAIVVHVTVSRTSFLFEVLSLAGAVAAAVVSLTALVFFVRSGGTDGAEARTRLENEALTDSLTGLRNHRAFQEDLARELARAETAGRSVGLVLVDVDGLKTVNDTNGHQAGDELIVCVSDAMRGTLRQRDVAYRIGGDEFAVLLPAETTWGAFRYAQRFQAALAGTPGEMRPSASAGVSAFRGQPRDELVREADLALIAAKRGRRGVLIYTDDLAVREQGYSNPDRTNHLDLICAALARAVDIKDRFTRGHCELVAELSSLIAREMGMPVDTVAKVRRAGLLHDVGKIGIPDSIIMKGGSLTQEEREVIQTHSELGHRIVSGTGLDEEARWVLHHHERVDGSGYPAGLVESEIPLPSAIIFVADAFEAMTTDRPYRKARSTSDALAELERHAGTQFRGDVVAVLATVIANGGLAGASEDESETSETEWAKSPLSLR